MNFFLSGLSHLLYLKKETQVSGVRAIPVPPRRWGGPEGILRRDSGLPMGFSTQCQCCIYVFPQPISTKCINSLLRSCQESWIFFQQPRMHACMLNRFNHVQLFVALWTIACQAPLSTGFSRQEYWSGLPFSSPGDLPDSGIESRSPASQADSLPLEPRVKPPSSLED